MSVAVQLTLDDLARIANEEYHLARSAFGSMVDHAIRAGDALRQAKAKVKHGEWLPWLATNFDGSEKNAENYMRLAANPQRVADMGPDQSFRSVLAALKAGEMRSRDAAARTIARAAMRDDSGEGFHLHLADLNDAEVADGSVDLIVTDPPYPVEFSGAWDDLAAFAVRVLKPGGIVAAMSGKIHLPDRMASLAAKFEYGWIYAQTLPNASTRILARHVGQEWKPWICYSKGEWPSGRIDWHGDLIAGGGREKSLYHWQQSVAPAEFLVRTLSPSDGVVCDPFMGSGSFGIAALRADREFIGIEPDATRYQQARARLMDWKEAAA